MAEMRLELYGGRGGQIGPARMKREMGVEIEN